jgi:8-oxo-dGTP pyrophosphatase MutT (NUDIX family)
VASKRELAEETGIVASDWTFLGKTRMAGGLTTERTAFLLARDLSYKDRVDADDKDLIEKGKFWAIGKNVLVFSWFSVCY